MKGRQQQARSNGILLCIVGDKAIDKRGAGEEREE
jgi:hypothetical protein